LEQEMREVMARKNVLEEMIKASDDQTQKNEFRGQYTELTKKEDELKPAIANAWVGKYRDVYQPPTGWIGDKPVHKMVRGKGYNDNTIRR
jgi:hypothetical protein